MGSWKGGGNQYIQLVKVLYCKLPINSKQLPAFPLEVWPRTKPRPQRRECYHSATVPPPMHGDARLIDFLIYDLLDMAGKRPDQKSAANHSAQSYLRKVKKFLQKEIKLGAMIGPLNKLLFQCRHVSPLMSRPTDIDDLRIIVDLSYGVEESVNGCTTYRFYDGSPYSLSLPSLDYLIVEALSIEKPKLIKVNVAHCIHKS